MIQKLVNQLVSEVPGEKNSNTERYLRKSSVTERTVCSLRAQKLNSNIPKSQQTATER